MKHKKTYLIWREKNDFFTALSINGLLYTWSLFTGELLYKRDVKKDFKVDCSNYEIYRANSKDRTYTKNNYKNY